MGDPHSTADIIAALKCIEGEMVRNPLAMAKSGEPLLLHYMVIRDVLLGELVARKKRQEKGTSA